MRGGGAGVGAEEDDGSGEGRGMGSGEASCGGRGCVLEVGLAEVEEESRKISPTAA